MVVRLFIVLLLLVSSSSYAAFTASVNKNPVLAGEFFVLSLQLDSSANGQQPDTSALLKDFVVGPTNTSSGMRSINGQVSRNTTWSIELMVRNPGNYTIPAFTVNGQTTAPINLTVLKADSAQTKNNDIFITTSIESDSLYVQQAGVYTVKLHLAADLSEGQLGAPTLADASVSQLGKQTENYEIIDGKRYLVVTRNYLIQPQQSGEYTIKGPVFKGRVRQNYRSVAASALGEDIQLTVKPIPNAVTGNWLPSELVTLDDEWAPDKTEFEVGEPITRTITLTALGITKEQLPELQLPNMKGIRSYSDQADNNHVVRNNQVISQRVESFALMPQIPGTYELPEVRIPWFNVVTNQLDYAVLPSKTITVTGDFVPPADNVAVANDQAPSNVTQPQTTTYTSIEYKTNWWLIGSGYGLWVLTLIVWFLTRNKNNTASRKNDPKPNNRNGIEVLVQHAKNNDTKAFYSELIRYQQAELGAKNASLEFIIDYLNSDKAAQEIRNLQHNLYGSAKQNVDLKTIINELKKINKTHNSSVLNEMYQ